MSASMRLYFTFERISYHESTISFKSVLLDYITFTFHLFNMPLIEGSAEISLLHINEQGKESILNDFLLDEYQDNVTVNAEKAQLLLDSIFGEELLIDTRSILPVGRSKR